ncbi:MAG: DUF1508 domain-containing protein [Clostridia bacterium]|nr:DUF1508 domain-containing protein [Clostridia bacterium]
MIQAIKNFLNSLIEEHFYLTCALILLMVITIFALIILSTKRKIEKSKLEKELFNQESMQSLTPEEIDNISNNSSNPEEVKQSLTTEVEEAKASRKPATETTKPRNHISKPKKATKPAVKDDVSKPEEKPTQTRKPKAVKPKEEKPALVEPQKPAVKPEPVQAKPEEKPAPKKQYTGKWRIVPEEDGWYAILTASNGGTLLKTEKYKSITNVKNGIETIKKNVDSGNFAISVDKYGHYRFKLFNLSNRLICVSEDYSSKAKCESGVESVKRFAKTAMVIQEDK